LSKTPVTIEVRIANPSVSFWCVNPGGQDGGLGNPFFFDVDLTELDTVSSADVTKSGKTLAEIVFEDCDIVQGLFPNWPNDLPTGICKDNWTVKDVCTTSPDEGTIKVWEFDILFIPWYMPDGYGGEWAPSEVQAYHAVLGNDTGLGYIPYDLTGCTYNGDDFNPVGPNDPGWSWLGCTTD